MHSGTRATNKSAQNPTQTRASKLSDYLETDKIDKLFHHTSANLVFFFPQIFFAMDIFLAQTEVNNYNCLNLPLQLTTAVFQSQVPHTFTVAPKAK